MRLDDSGRVVAGIEADGEEVHPLPQPGIAGDGALQLTETPIHQRAEVRQRTSCVHECDGERLASPVGQLVRRPGLVLQRVVRNLIPRLHDIHGFHGAGAGGHLRVPGLLEVRDVHVAALQHERCGDEVSRREAVEDGRFPDKIRHRHRRHEAGDVVVLERDFATTVGARLGPDRENLSAQGVPFIQLSLAPGLHGCKADEGGH